MIQKTTELAYLAGYLDGDGCFFIGFEHRKKCLKPKSVISIVINSVNKTTLDGFKKVFGGSVSLIMEAHDNSKALYHYVIRKRNTLAFIHKILPYLVEKREECQLAIDFSQSNDIAFKTICINKMKILKDVTNLVSKYHKNEFELNRSCVDPSEEDFAYLAGFIDAECNLGIQKYKPKDRPNAVYKIILQCNNTKAPVFKWLLERYGGQVHFIDRLKALKARKNQLTWRISGNALSLIIKRIYPFLRHKKQVCEELIKFYETTLPNGGARHTEEFRSSYAQVIQQREDIVHKVHQLNLKGISHLSG